MRLNITLKGYLYRQHAGLYIDRDGSATTLLLLLEVFTQGHFVGEYIRLHLNFFRKQLQIRFLSHTLGS